MKNRLYQIGIRILFLFTVFGTKEAYAQLQRAHVIQNEIEQSIKGIIGSQLGESEYFIYAKVKIKDDGSQAAADAASTDKLLNVPYSPVRVEKAYLEDMLRKGQGRYPEIEQLTVTIVFDQRVPKEKVDLLSTVIRDRFEFNESNRILEIKSLSLVTEPVQQQEKLVLEKSKLENERTLLEIQSLKEKFEITKREEDLKKRIMDLEAQQAEASKQQPAAAAESAQPTAPGTTVAAEKEKGPIDYLQSFQLILVAVLGGLFLLIIVLLTGGLMRKGLQPMADAIAKIGDGVGNIAPAASVAAAPVAAAAAGGMVTSTNDRAQGGEIGAIGAAGVHAQFGQMEDKSFEEFMTAITEKMKILMEEKNFSFYRHFCDMVDAPASRKYAASILLSMEEKNVANLLKGISLDHIEVLKEYLARPGAVPEAQSIKKIAMQEFFGRIAAEEFSGSPLSKVKNMTWLTSMDSSSMAEFITVLEPKLKVALLACLTPARVNGVISAIPDIDSKKQILSALKELESIDAKDVEEGLKKIAEVREKNKAGEKEDKRKFVDTAKYMAQMAEQLPPEERILLMEEINADENLSKKMREHIIPFDAVKRLPKELRSEIFTARSDLQLAQILFGVADDVKEKIIDVLPEIRKENVKSELSLIEGNKVFAKRNSKTAMAMQAEICRYLLSLYKEGILDLDGQEKNTDTEAEPGGTLGNVA